MAVLNPQHLLEQARALVALYPRRKPRQVDLRRTISSAYYAVFHCISTAAADEFLGSTLRGDPRYVLIYRSIEHRRTKQLCEVVASSEKYRKYIRNRPLSAAIKNFANAFPALQSKRHEADYDPSVSLTTLDALSVIELAERAIAAFETAPQEDRKLFLTFLLFPPR